MKKKVLIFGGSRFLGKALIKFIRENRKSWELYSLTQQSKTSLVSENKSLLADRRDRSSLESSLKNLCFDFIFDLSSYFKEDLQISLDLMSERAKSWIFVSSAGVYRPTKEFPFREESAKIDRLPHLGKLECENLLKTYKNLHSVYLRPFYIYGEGNSFDRESFFFRVISQEQKIYLPENSKNTLLQLIEVSELARLIVEIAEIKDQSRTNQQAFNLGDQEIYTIESILETCAEILGKKHKIQYLSKEFLEKHNLGSRDIFPLRTDHYFGDLSKLNYLGLKTKLALREGLKKSFQYYSKNKEQYPDFVVQPKLEKVIRQKQS